MEILNNIGHKVIKSSAISNRENWTAIIYHACGRQALEPRMTLDSLWKYMYVWLMILAKKALEENNTLITKDMQNYVCKDIKEVILHEQHN